MIPLLSLSWTGWYRDGLGVMIIIIQCAASKRSDAGRVRFG
jgi:hypothetical protein